ncbi:unnamed protein product [Caenorhabditis angaria]|uniref:Uncharacterized protein n=1 Tax=Caenorhabditis angaria TaxID=860376 RepID=A0A9P1IXD4_9PELO|nr:unnamed protein product [Caenorhabditis angaria]
MTNYHLESDFHIVCTFFYSIVLLIAVMALLAQRNRQYRTEERMQQLWLNQIYDSYAIRSKTLQLRIKQLSDHRNVYLGDETNKNQ